MSVFPTGVSLRTAAGKAAVVAPVALGLSYVDAWCVRASTGGLGWLFGTEFWLMVLIIAGLWVRSWTDEDDRWVQVLVLGVLVAGLVAGPLLLFHGALAALAAVSGVAVLGTAATVVARVFGFDVQRRDSLPW
ncbi:hypothetical protein ACFWVP_29590 [Streptomyces sp. NPDC058637]|uniref:hypothetical protein n=1 Tax=Streptomyces sp. NPDC058637 TaxID=3346569 RepID=UPI00365FE783